MKPATAEVLKEIKSCVADGQKTIVPAIFSHCYGRAATSAAFRIARAEKIIEVAYISCVGTPVYQGYGVAAALEEAKTATKN